LKRERTALYRFYDCIGELLYIGIAHAPWARMGQHANESAWYEDASFVKIVWYESIEDAKSAEAAAIVAEIPAWNVAHNHRAIQDPQDKPCQIRGFDYPDLPPYGWGHGTPIGAGLKRIQEAMELAERRVTTSQLRAAGVSVREIAERLGICQGSVYNDLREVRSFDGAHAPALPASKP
jgi:predicted GIY-YIG superfamily endonuclease/DNA-binding CsgD family transcriptional regulator